MHYDEDKLLSNEHKPANLPENEDLLVGADLAPSANVSERTEAEAPCSAKVADQPVRILEADETLLQSDKKVKSKSKRAQFDTDASPKDKGLERSREKNTGVSKKLFVLPSHALAKAHALPPLEAVELGADLEAADLEAVDLGAVDFVPPVAEKPPEKQDLEGFLESGDRALKRNDFQLAAERFEAALLILKTEQVQDSGKMIHCLRNLVDAYLNLKDADRTLSALEDMTKINPLAAQSADTVMILGQAAMLYADNGQRDQSSATYFKAMELASEILAVNDPVLLELNNSYIEARKKYSTKEVSAPLNEGEAQSVLAVSLKRPPSNMLEKPLPIKPITPTTTTTPTTPKPGAVSRNGNETLSRFAGAAGRAFEHQGVRTALNAPWLMVLVSALFLICVAKICTVQLRGSVSSKPAMAMPTDFSDMQFESCDQKSAIKFLSKEQCSISRSGRSTEAKYTLLSGGLPDLATLFQGYLQRNELWYQCDAAGLVGADKVVLYRPNAPELAIVRKMWWYASFAQSYYREGRLYPSDAEKCKASDPNFVYSNPFTHQTDYAAIILQKRINGELNEIDFSSRGANNRHWRPGAILCLCSDYHKFLVQGFDRYGKPLTSSDPSRYFVIECKSGIDLTKLEQEHAESLQPLTDNKAPVQVFLYESANLEATVQWLRRLSQVLLWTLMCLACFSCYASHKSNQGGKVKIFSIAAVVSSMLFLAALYIFALQSSG
jgi:tetratricopeptide (TPR) repeat protein